MSKPAATVNALLDALPRPWRGALGRRGPTFRACGVIGFYLATLTIVFAALATARSIWVAAMITMVSGVSFFASSYLRKWITGHEQLVLLEQVWFAEAAVVGVLLALDLPLLPNLDLLAVALCPFLAWGRTGCLLVGCCHGQPSSIGVRYDASCVRAGFSRDLEGVRLFPIQLVELVALYAIGAGAFVLLLVAPVGTALVWFLAAYAVVRFGLEDHRGDRRPYLLGWSQAQWMSVAEIGVALALVVRPFHAQHPVAASVIAGTMASLIVLGLIVRRRTDLRPRFLADVPAVRALARAQQSQTTVPSIGRTDSGVGVVSSPLDEARFHVSLSLPDDRHDLELLAMIAARGLPECDAGAASTLDGRVLHLQVPRLAEAMPESIHPHAIYGPAVRAAQRAPQASEESKLEAPRPEPIEMKREQYFGAQDG